MADSKENESLGGLARSIDSLFSSASPDEPGQGEGKESGGVSGVDETDPEASGAPRAPVPTDEANPEVADLPRVPTALDQRAYPTDAGSSMEDSPPAEKREASEHPEPDHPSLLDWPPSTGAERVTEESEGHEADDASESGPQGSDPGGAEVMFDSLEDLPDATSEPPRPPPDVELEASPAQTFAVEELSEEGKSLAAGPEELLFENLTLVHGLPPAEPIHDPAADEQEPEDLLKPGETPTLVDGLPPARPIQDPFAEDEGSKDVLGPDETPTLVDDLPPAEPILSPYEHPTDFEGELAEGELPTLAPGWLEEDAEERAVAAGEALVDPWTADPSAPRDLDRSGPDEAALDTPGSEAKPVGPTEPIGPAETTQLEEPVVPEESTAADGSTSAEAEELDASEQARLSEDEAAHAPLAGPVTVGERADADARVEESSSDESTTTKPVDSTGDSSGGLQADWPTADPDVLVARPPLGVDGQVPAPDPLTLAVEAYLESSVGDDAVRKAAKRLVEERRYGPVAAAIERLAQHAHRSGSEEALELAKGMLGPLVLSRLLQRLGSEREEARRNGYHEACLALGEEMAAAIRDELAQSDDRTARRAYFDTLVAMAPVSRGVIEEMVESENKFLARNGVALLAEIGGERAEELVMAAVWDSDPRVRREAIRTLARLELESTEQLVLQLIEDSDRKVRMEAIKYAAEVHMERAVRPIVGALDRTQETEDLLVLLGALGRLGDPGAVPSIEKHAVPTFFRRPQTEVRIEAYRALQQIGTPHARQLLDEATRDREQAVQVAVTEMLAES